jgi:hypothetical protein
MLALNELPQKQSAVPNKNYCFETIKKTLAKKNLDLFIMVSL